MAGSVSNTTICVVASVATLVVAISAILFTTSRIDKIEDVVNLNRLSIEGNVRHLSKIEANMEPFREHRVGPGHSQTLDKVTRIESRQDVFEANLSLLNAEVRRIRQSLIEKGIGIVPLEKSAGHAMNERNP